MLSRMTNLVLGAIGSVLFATFIIGLASSISIGFAGFWGGLPFGIISAIILGMAAYYWYEETVRNR